MNVNNQSQTNIVRHHLAESILSTWGEWFRLENSVDVGLGYPRMSAFLNAVVSGTRYESAIMDVFGGREISQTTLIVQAMLLVHPLYFNVAQCSFAYCRDLSYDDKARWIIKNKGIYLGSSNNSARIKFKQLESETIAFIAGAFQMLEFEQS